MRRLILAALVALAIVAPAAAQDTLSTSTAPAPTQIRLPLVRTVADGNRVVLQVVGSTDVPTGDTTGLYVGPNGFVVNIAQAQDIRGTPGASAVANPVPGPMGAPGKSAYQSWLDDGNEGTEAAFVASLKGQQGTPGIAGAAGPAGQSAYALWIAQGNTGTAQQFLESLVGAAGSNGSNGTNGASAELRVQGGFIQWRAGAGSWANLVALADLTGPAGPAGSAGATGAKGDTGSTPTLSIGTVSTLAAGSPATATLSGTGIAPVLNLGIPAGLQGPAAATSVVFLNNVTLAQTAVIAISAGPRQVAVATNCQVNDRLVMHPVAALPAGYMLGDMVCSANGTALATLYAPLLAIGANYSIAVRVTAFR